jgi:hypothetical protein
MDWFLIVLSVYLVYAPYPIAQGFYKVSQKFNRHENYTRDLYSLILTCVVVVVALINLAASII